MFREGLTEKVTLDLRNGGGSPMWALEERLSLEEQSVQRPCGRILLGGLRSSEVIVAGSE